MHARSLLLLAAVLALAAGCVVSTQPQQSTSGNPSPSEGANSRELTVNVPAGATQLRVDTSATTQSGQPDVTVLVKDESGNILGSHTWALKDRSTDSLTVSTNGQATLVVVARVVDGDASLDVNVTALVPGQPEVTVLHQTIVITQVVVTTTTTPTPTSSTPMPTPTPTPTPTPSATTTTPPTVNNSTNATG
jgi:hypothetical protein